MKKLPLIFIFCAGLLASCFDNKVEYDPYDLGYNMYVDVFEQDRLALDPFNVAFRLNTWLVEKAADNPDTVAIADTLFGTLVRPELIEAGTYQLDYPVGYSGILGGKFVDSRRHGKIRIQTGGKKLGESGAAWEVYSENLNLSPFRWDIPTEWAGYGVNYLQDNQWSVTMTSFAANYNYTSDWNTHYIVVQKGVMDQSFNSVKKAEYLLHINCPQTLQPDDDYEYNDNRIPWGQTAFGSFIYKHKTPVQRPIKYNMKCGYGEMTPGGRIILGTEEWGTYQMDPESKTDVLHIEGVSSEECGVGFRVSYKGRTKNFYYRY